jgi:HTH-type transcriptional regulator/antitoxin HigA
MMDVKPLHNERDYTGRSAKYRVISNPNPSPAPPMAIVSKFYPTLIKAYEDKHFATKHGDPVDVLHFAIESMGGRKRNWPA